MTEEQLLTEPQGDQYNAHTTNKWRIFKAFLTLKDGTKTTYISSTLGGEAEAKKAAINNDWSSSVVDVIISFR